MEQLQQMLDALAARDDVEPEALEEVIALIEAGELEQAQDKAASLLQ